MDYDGDAHACVDRAHQVHHDGKGYSCLHLTMETGSMMSVSNKLDLVSMSSTEIEIASTGERFPRCT